MAEYTLPIIMLIVFVLGICSGYPVAFVLAGIGVVFTFAADIPPAFLGTVVSRIFTGILSNWVLLAIPLFVFMGLMLEKSGAAGRLLRSLEQIFGKRPGGLAISVAFLGIIMAASTGIIGASVVMLSVLALPMMINQGYDKGIATGTICASGTLGILIPPSIMLILLGDILQVSVGDLFSAAMVPGLVLGGVYVVYILITGMLRPTSMPPGDKVVSVSLGQLLIDLARDLFAPLLLIVSVLGSILLGIATPTEAAGIGAAGTFVLAALSGSLSFRAIAESVYETGKTTAMILAIAIGANCFIAIFKRVGGSHMIEDTVGLIGGGAFGTLAAMMLIIFLLGFILEWIEICYIVLPLFAPVVAGLDFGLGLSSDDQLIWFAIIIAINLQTSFLTPPFGYALFYLKGVAPPEVQLSDIYRGITPFIVLQLLILSAAILFPQLVLWLPGVSGS